MLHKAHCHTGAQWKQWWKGGDLHLFTLSHATIAYDRHCADVGKDHHHDNIRVTHTQLQPPELTPKVGNLLLHADFLWGWIGELDKQGPKSRHIGEQAGTGQITPEMQQQPMIALVVNEATSQCALWGSTANVGLGSPVHI